MTRMIQVEVKSTLNGQTDTLSIETNYSSLAELCNGEGWAAALNGFDVDCKYATGAIEADAVSNLIDSLDFQATQELTF